MYTYRYTLLTIELDVYWYILLDIEWHLYEHYWTLLDSSGHYYIIFSLWLLMATITNVATMIIWKHLIYKNVPFGSKSDRWRITQHVYPYIGTYGYCIYHWQHTWRQMAIYKDVCIDSTMIYNTLMMNETIVQITI